MIEKPDLPPEEGEFKGATRRLLLEAAMELIQQGDIPSVAEVARRAKVSRATAYRYFPGSSALITAVIDASLGPVRTFPSTEADGRKRVEELFTVTFPRFVKYEPQMRAAAQLALEHWAKQRAGTLKEKAYRRGHRVGILAHALEPFRNSLSASVLDRLHKALSVIYGIEPHVILKDIWGLDEQEVEAVALWMANALVEAALREAEG